MPGFPFQVSTVPPGAACCDERKRTKGNFSLGQMTRRYRSSGFRALAALAISLLSLSSATTAKVPPSRSPDDTSTQLDSPNPGAAALGADHLVSAAPTLPRSQHVSSFRLDTEFRPTSTSDEIEHDTDFYEGLVYPQSNAAKGASTCPRTIPAAFLAAATDERDTNREGPAASLPLAGTRDGPAAVGATQTGVAVEVPPTAGITPVVEGVVASEDRQGGVSTVEPKVANRGELELKGEREGHAGEDTGGDGPADGLIRGENGGAAAAAALKTGERHAETSDADGLPARRASRRPRLDETGGIGSKGQGPIVGSWREQEEERKGEAPSRQTEDGHNLADRAAFRQSSTATTKTDVASDVAVGSFAPQEGRIGSCVGGGDEGGDRWDLQTAGIPQESCSPDLAFLGEAKDAVSGGRVDKGARGFPGGIEAVGAAAAVPDVLEQAMCNGEACLPPRKDDAEVNRRQVDTEVGEAASLAEVATEDSSADAVGSSARADGEVSSTERHLDVGGGEKAGAVPVVHGELLNLGQGDVEIFTREQQASSDGEAQARERPSKGEAAGGIYRDDYGRDERVQIESSFHPESEPDARYFPTTAVPAVRIQEGRGPRVKAVGRNIRDTNVNPRAADEYAVEGGGETVEGDRDGSHDPVERQHRERGRGGRHLPEAGKGAKAKAAGAEKEEDEDEEERGLFRDMMQSSWKSPVYTLLMGAVLIVLYLQGRILPWLPFFNGDPREGWALDLDTAIASARSRAGSFCSGRSSGISYSADDLGLPELISDDEPAALVRHNGDVPTTKRASGPVEAVNDSNDGGVPLMWDTRPKSFDRLLFDPVLGVVPSGVLEAWACAKPAGTGGSGRQGCAARPTPRAAGETLNDTDLADDECSPRVACSGEVVTLGRKCQQRQLPPVRYTPEWHAWRAERREAIDRVGERSETEEQTSLAAAGAGGGGQKAGVPTATVAMAKVTPRPSKSSTPAAISLQFEDVGGTGAGSDAERGGGGADGDGNFSEDSSHESRDIPEFSAGLSSGSRPVMYRVA